MMSTAMLALHVKRAFAALTLLTALAFAQAPSASSDPKDRIKTIRELAKRDDPVKTISAYLNDPAVEVRMEVVRRLNEIGGARVVPGLVTATADSDAEVQIHATDGLVDIFLPGYAKNGIARTTSRSGDVVKVRFNDPGDLVVDGYVRVAPEVITALTNVLANSKNPAARANAARALGMLRAESAVPALGNALYSKDDQLMYESVIALQKIRDVSAGPRIAFLVRDLNEKIQIAALRACGVLRVQSAAPNIRRLIDDGPNPRVMHEALSALGMIGDPADHGVFLRFLSNKDANLREDSAEGLGRIKNTMDVERLQQAFNDEREFGPRLAMAFALANLGRLEINELSPYRYLINALDRATFRNVSLAYLTELAREPGARQTLYTTLDRATGDEKTGLCLVFGESGEKDTLPYLNRLKDDKDQGVAQTCLRSLRTLEARLK
jgi:HEAT repeat protein